MNEEIFKDNPESKVKGKLAHIVFLIAIEKQVNTEIDKMVQQGYWTPVSQYKWAMPLVPVPKMDGGVRICGDYKPTVNTQIEVAHHPLSYSRGGKNRVRTFRLVFKRLHDNDVRIKPENYSQIDKESLALVALKHFHFFLYGHKKLRIYSDHKPLISLFD